ALAGLRPSLVLTQAVCEVCAVPTPGVLQTVEQLGLDARVLSLDAHTMADIVDSVRQVADAAGVPDRGRVVAESLEGRLAAVRDAVGTPATARPRVLAIEWLDPPFTPGHWVPEMIEMAGGTCLSGTAGSPSVQTTWEDLLGLDPDVLLVMPCGYGLGASRDEAETHRDRLREVAPRAVSEGRAWVLDGSSYFNRSGPRAVDGVEILAGILHPGRWPQPSPEAAIPWK
ncbi:MAG TPA: ABC transporter substrate-binding protein, partial [Longimicrobiales bacterium]|nr:ABC transporter substrate-binding protein [Longimicrobiales bacterium]